MKTKLAILTVASFISLQCAFAAPVAGCYQLNPPGSWSELLIGGADGAVGNQISAWDNATYYFSGATLAEVQPDTTGQWDWITRYDGGILVLSNSVGTQWFMPCDSGTATQVAISNVVVKTRSTRFTNEVGRLEFELTGTSGAFSFNATYAGVPTTAALDTNVLVTADLTSAEICIGQRARMNVAQSTINLSSRGVLPTVLFGSATLDVTKLDIASIKLECAPSLRTHLVDINQDGYKDLLMKFSTPEVAKTLSDVTDKSVTTLFLTGTSLDGTPISATDKARILNKNKPQKPAKPVKPSKPGKK